MGAAIYYLYKTKGYKHFFILAPGNTIYDKLRKESNPSHPKYIFKGLEAEMGRPKVYDGENYTSYPVRYVQGEIEIEKTSEIQLFIFNIGKNNRLYGLDFWMFTAKLTDDVLTIFVQSKSVTNFHLLNIVCRISAHNETEDNIRKLLSIERTDNPVEIVLHVYKLKEGWDVNNLFTIIPLNAAKSDILALPSVSLAGSSNKDCCKIGSSGFFFLLSPKVLSYASNNFDCVRESSTSANDVTPAIVSKSSSSDSCSSFTEL